MSCEGTRRYLCKNGHLSEFDFYTSGYRFDFKCSVCGEGEAWHESVDETNGSEESDFTKLEVIKPCHCPRCDFSGQMNPATYKIPT